MLHTDKTDEQLKMFITTNLKYSPYKTVSRPLITTCYKELID